MIRVLLLTIAACAVAGTAMAAPAAELPRRAWLGAGLKVGADKAVTVSELLTPSLGLKVGDVVLEVDGRPVSSTSEVASAVAARGGGEAGRLKVRRGGREMTLSGRYATRPTETYQGGSAAYGVTAFEGGRLRDILVTPTGGAKGPVLFLIQGYTCDSMEAAQGSSHQQLIEGLLARGISTYRIEKPRAGDSRGGPDCAAMDFATEVAAFKAGYARLTGELSVAPDRIFILGHSLGGLEAPLLAQAGPSPRGVAVYGTVARNWRDYLLDVLKYQGFMAGGADPAKGEIDGEKLRPLIEKIYARKLSPAQVAAESPETAELLKTWLGWDGGTGLMGRDVSFWRGISETRFMSAWRDTKSQVLAIYGESDFAAVDAEDHKLIAEVANHYRPGTGRFVLLPKTGHGMRLDGDRAQAKARDADAPPGPFNSELVPLIGDWIAASMAKPPVGA